MQANEQLFLIDGNSVFYREFYALPITMKNSKGECTNALYGFCNQLIKILLQYKPKYMAVAFDVSKHTFRNDIYDKYKATRKPMPPELKMQFEPLKKMLKLMGIVCVEREGLEGDDILGSLAKKFDVSTVIVTGDRDSFQLVDDSTVVYLNKKGMSELRLMTPKVLFDEYGITPDEFVFVKSLAGDTADNIPGASGVGEKTALSLIQKYHTIDGIYENIEEIKGALKEKLINSKDQVYMSYKLAKINTELDIPVSLDDLLVKFPFNGEVLNFFRKNNFMSLVNKKELFALNDNALESLDVAAPVKKPNKKLSLNNISAFINNVTKNREMSFVMYKGKYHFSDAEEDYELDDESEFKDCLMALKPVIEDEKIKKVLFNSKQERKMLIKNGINLSGNVFDCMIAKHLCNGDKVTEFAQLTDDYEFLENCPAFCLITTGVTLIETLERYGMKNLYYNLELPLSVVLFNMEERGFKLDLARVEELKVKYNAEIEKLTKEIYEIAGKEFNINSPKQLGELIYDELKLGRSKKKSTAVEALEKMVDRHPLIPLIIRYRKVSKFLSTSIVGTLNFVDNNGYVHTNFNQTLTTTGRLSSSEPNLQNIPVRGEESREIRSMFVASDKNSVLIDADYSQIELRILAHLCEDELLIKSFESGRDIHTETACQIYNVTPDLVTADMRRLAKVVNFGINYGISDYGLATDLNISVPEARQYIENYYANHPKVKEYMEKCVSDARETGRVTTLLGRTRKMSDINSSNYLVRQGAERASQNMPVQGSAADIMKIAMLNIEKRLTDGAFKAKLIMQVHDELIVDSPIAEADEVKKIVETEMTNAYKLLVPLVVDSSVSYRWSEGH